ncbi:MAG: hypothetical protein A3C27_02395 [Candidatus Levybacteria bacterium RIFCSPHIGHO2_02_FULL_39_36]|nr:MAG: hypothetical protein A3C27_02395 [Candidatus Levybacteria bacterium RIFCSPHIGHO2_02_FULL_39_36]
MQNDIRSKLSEELTKEFKYESQIVYILSRVRKLLEIEGKKRKYRVLNFYCNWSLHSKIERTDPVGRILKEFIERVGERHNFIFHTEFISELNQFLNEHELPSLGRNKIDKFIALLTETISDTPLEVVLGTKYTIVLKQNLSEGMGYVITTKELYD